MVLSYSGTRRASTYPGSPSLCPNRMPRPSSQSFFFYLSQGHWTLLLGGTEIRGTVLLAPKHLPATNCDIMIAQNVRYPPTPCGLTSDCARRLHRGKDSTISRIFWDHVSERVTRGWRCGTAVRCTYLLCGKSLRKLLMIRGVFASYSLCKLWKCSSVIHM